MKTKLREVLKNLVKIQNDTFKDHSEDVSQLAYQTALQVKQDWPELELDDSFPVNFKTAVTVHDIGKLRIPRNILAKPSTLTENEYRIIQKHTNYGIDILDESVDADSLEKGEFKLYVMCQEIILGHHERLDGSGYPFALSGHLIPISARIVAVIDSYDAMISSRVYKDAMDSKEALDSLMEETDKYDIRILQSFEKVIEKRNMD